MGCGGILSVGFFMNFRGAIKKKLGFCPALSVSVMKILAFPNCNLNDKKKKTQTV